MCNIPYVWSVNPHRRIDKYIYRASATTWINHFETYIWWHRYVLTTSDASPINSTFVRWHYVSCLATWNRHPFPWIAILFSDDWVICIAFLKTRLSACVCAERKYWQCSHFVLSFIYHVRNIVLHLPSEECYSPRNAYALPWVTDTFVLSTQIKFMDEIKWNSNQEHYSTRLDLILLWFLLCVLHASHCAFVIGKRFDEGEYWIIKHM